MATTTTPARLVREDGKPEPLRFRFTVKQLDRITPAEDKQVWAYDTDTRGLAMLTTPAGAKTFYLARRMDGRYRRVKIGAFPEVSIERARKKAASLIGDIVDGENPAEAKRQARDATTFGGLFDYYMTSHAKLHKRGWKRDQRAYELYLERWATRRLDSITRADVAALHAKIGRKYPIGANRVLALVSKVFNVAAAIGFDGRNPAQGVKRFAENQKDRYIDASEMPAFLRELDAEPGQDVRDILYAMLLTGARRGNVLSMEWVEVNLTRRVWTIPAAKYKTGKATEVPIVPALLKILKRRQEKAYGPYVFPNRRKNPKCPHAREPGGALERICERAGIDKVTPHDLRRTLASWATVGGVPYPIVAGMLGHKARGVTAIYARFDLPAVRDAFDKTAEAMLNCKSTKKRAPRKARK